MPADLEACASDDCGGEVAVEPLIAAHVRAEAAAGECEREDCQQIAHTASVVYCELTGGKLSYPTYPASTVVAEANDYTQQLIDEECARVRAAAVADERQRLADAILPHHWRTMQLWGGVPRLACGRCRYGDGVCFLWPCPTRRAITGEPEPEADSDLFVAAGSVPIATPPELAVEDVAALELAAARREMTDARAALGRTLAADYERHRAAEGLDAGPVATPTEPDEHERQHLEYGTWPCAWRGSAECPIVEEIAAAASPIPAVQPPTGREAEHG